MRHVLVIGVSLLSIPIFTPASSAATVEKVSASQNTQIQALLKHAPTKDIWALETALNKFPTTVLLPSKLPFQVTGAMVSFTKGHGLSPQQKTMPQLQMKFLNSRTKQMIEETVWNVGHSAFELETSSPSKPLRLKNGEKATVARSFTSEVLGWAYHGDFYMVESDKNATHPMFTVKQIKIIANDMK